VNLSNGIYVFENGVTTNGAITTVNTLVNGQPSGATLEIQSGAWTVNTGTTLNLTAPIGGPTNGIVLMQPLSNTNQITIQRGTATGSLTGIIYAPGAQLYLQDSGGQQSTDALSITSDIIVDQLFDKTATINITSYSASFPSTPLRAVTLVE
jgi:hypothetical protein